MGIMVKVFNESLSNALQKMKDKKVNIIIMYYFLEITDSEIADLMGLNRSTVFRNRKKALEELKELIGDNYYEVR
jgi:RNA polymerase sigma factor (sigma-70 family)